MQEQPGRRRDHEQYSQDRYEVEVMFPEHDIEEAGEDDLRQTDDRHLRWMPERKRARHRQLPDRSRQADAPEQQQQSLVPQNPVARIRARQHDKGQRAEGGNRREVNDHGVRADAAQPVQADYADRPAERMGQRRQPRQISARQMRSLNQDDARNRRRDSYPDLRRRAIAQQHPCQQSHPHGDGITERQGRRDRQVRERVERTQDAYAACETAYPERRGPDEEKLDAPGEGERQREHERYRRAGHGHHLPTAKLTRQMPERTRSEEHTSELQ